MMQVPEWLLILLSAFSIILLVLVLLFLATVIRNCLRRRKYDQIKPKGKYVPGKVIAYFKGNDERNLSMIPKTYPAVMQTGNPLLTASWKVIPHTTSGGSSASSNHRTSSVCSKVNEQRSLVSQYAFQAIGENLQRKSARTGPVPVEMRRIRSPLTEMKTDETTSQRSSRSGSVGEIIKSDEFSKVTTDTCDQVYSHSEFLIDMDNAGPFEDPESPVISYDQDNYPVVPKPPGPGSLFFMLEYNSQVPELLVTIKSGLDLPPVSGDVNSPLNSYVNFCLVPEDFLWQRTNVITNDKDPVFNETFRIRDVLYHKLREYTLCFFVMDCTQMMGERVIGKVLYPLSDLRAEDKIEVCKELSSP